MWIEKLADGVLQVETPIGARFIRPSFFERAYLLWMFRNFDSLPQIRSERQLFDLRHGLNGGHGAAVAALPAGAGQTHDETRADAPEGSK